MRDKKGGPGGEDESQLLVVGKIRRETGIDRNSPKGGKAL